MTSPHRASAIRALITTPTPERPDPTENDPPPPCKHCEGSGEIFVRRDSRGRIDYIDGSPTSETTRCDACHGEGVEQ